MDSVLTIQDLTKRYNGKTPALDNINLDIPKGKIIGLLGPNGSGKTTLLKLCAGLLTPTSGEIQICGNQVGAETKAIVSYLPDRTYFDNKQTVRQMACNPDWKHRGELAFFHPYSRTVFLCRFRILRDPLLF